MTVKLPSTTFAIYLDYKALKQSVENVYEHIDTVMIHGYSDI